MKNPLKVIILILTITFFVSCTPTSITEDQTTPEQENYGTDSQTTSQADNERDGE